MKVRRGDIVLVDFPFSDRTGSKVRPALVVQADEWNQRMDDTILALITSSRNRRVDAATQLVIDITTLDGQQTGLRLHSVIQCENLLTYDQALILGVLGRLPRCRHCTDRCMSQGRLGHSVRVSNSTSLRRALPATQSVLPFGVGRSALGENLPRRIDER